MTDLDIIKAFGGAATLARTLQIKPPAIAYWKKKGIPKLRRIQLQTIRPEIFNEANLSVVQPAAEVRSD
jgi:hypothetical protein